MHVYVLLGQEGGHSHERPLLLSYVALGPSVFPVLFSLVPLLQAQV